MTEYKNHHYVPIWYQKRFLGAGETRLHYLNMQPTRIENGRKIPMRPVEHWGPRKCFCVDGLYFVKIPGMDRAVYEKQFFGHVDTKGKPAIDSIAETQESVPIPRDHFPRFFEYLSIQSLRTPKGLDWIRSHSPKQTSIESVLRALVHLRQRKCVMWTESFQELLYTNSDTTSFLISDHPVTSYNKACYPGSRSCTYPNDPHPAWKGTQTIFPLDSKRCFVLTHSEFAHKQNMVAQLTRNRTNARMFGTSLAAMHQIVRREISDSDVTCINQILKLRATRYVAAEKPETLYPEETCGKIDWPKLGTCLMPTTNLWRRTGNTYMGFTDGTVQMSDQFGRMADSDSAKEGARIAKEHLIRAIAKYREDKDKDN